MNVQALTEDRTVSPVHTTSLDVTTYHPCYGLTVPAPAGPLHIDHLVVSRYGLFIIETCRHGGWIAGDTRFPQWTSVYPGGARSHFPNPLTAAGDIAAALAEVLEVPCRAIVPVIVFRGDCELADVLPDNIVHGDPAGYIKSRHEPIFSEETVAELRLKLKHLERKNGGDDQHGTVETF